MTWFLDLRAQASGGGVARDVAIYNESTPAPVSNLLDAIGGQDVLVTTHGFNVNRADGRRKLGFWESWLTLPPGMVYVAVLWPGDSSWAMGLDYPIEGNEAIASGNLLARFILKNLRGVASLSFASHSLGARVVLQTIRGLGRNMHVRNLMLMAGAIDDSCLSVEYADAAQLVDRISVLASYHDDVLALAFPAGNLLAGIVTRGSPYWHGALGREGPQSTLQGRVRAGWQIPNPWNYGHHNYLPEDPPEASPLPLPQPVPQPMPPLNSDLPSCSNIKDWTAAWSAAVTSARLR